MLQFHSNRLFGLAFDYHGIAIPDKVGLKLVFRKADAPVDILAEDCLSVVVAWSNIASIKIQKGLFGGGDVVVAVRNGVGLEQVPFFDKDLLTLAVYQSNVDEIGPFEQEVNRLRRGAHDDDVDQVIDEVRDLLEKDWGEFKRQDE
jgi:hypothetical protein